MKMYITQSCRHLRLATGKYRVKKLADGELYIRVLDDPGKMCVVISSFPPPAEKFMELCLLLDALTRMKTKITLIITYFGYARQDRVTKKGEPVSLDVICRMIKQFSLQDIIIIHPHSSQMQHYLLHHSMYPFFAECLGDNTLLVAPDAGAFAFAQTVAEKYNLPYAWMEKQRTSPNVVEKMIFHGNAQGKRVLLLDDMIDGGGTVLRATELILNAGALSVDVYATHGLFSGDAIKKLVLSPLRKIYVTDSLPRKRGKKIIYLPLTPLLQKIIHSFL